MFAPIKKYAEEMAALARTQTASDSMVVVAGNLTSAGLRFVITIILAHALSKNGFGRLALWFAVMEVASVMSEVGLHTTMVRFVAADEDRDGRQIILRTMVIKGVLIALVIMGASLYFPHFIRRFEIEPDGAWLYWLALGGGLFLSCHGLALAVTQAYRRYTLYALLAAIINILRLAVLGTMFVLGMKNEAAMYVVFFAMPAAALLLGIALAWVSSSEQRRAGPATTDWKELVQFTVPLAVLQIAAIAMIHVNTFMLGTLDEQRALYVLAYQIAFIFPIITRALFAVLLPRVSAMKTAAQLANFRRRCLSLYPVVLGATALAILAVPILLAIVPKYASAAPIMRVVILCFGINVVASQMGLIFFSLKRLHCMTIIHGIQLACIIPLNHYVLIPKYGAFGAALALLLVTVPAVLATIMWTGKLIEELRASEGEDADG